MDISARNSGKRQLTKEDLLWLEGEARRLTISQEQLIKRIVEEMTWDRPAGSGGQANPDELVFEAVRALIPKRKGEKAAGKVATGAASFRRSFF